MTPQDAIALAFTIGIPALAYLHIQRVKQAAAAAEAKQKAEWAALWAVDYHNPTSPNYDPVKTQAEADAQAAADAAENA